jgi:DNA-binding response OmpR family regulator
MGNILFINGQTDRNWINSLKKAVDSLGYSLKTVDHKRLPKITQNYELVILDAGAIGNVDLTPIILSMRKSEPNARIVVVSSAPYWKEATETLLAGATDYIRKSDDQLALMDLLKYMNA